jgi:hypothetical protein
MPHTKNGGHRTEKDKNKETLGVSKEARMEKVMVILALLISVVGCKVRDPLYCQSDEDCIDVTGRPYCDLVGDKFGSDGKSNTCVPAPIADAGTLPDSGVVDALTTNPDSMEGSPDSSTPSQAFFDVAYVDRWIAPGGSQILMSGILVVVNTSNQTLDLSHMEILETTHDHQSATLTLESFTGFFPVLQPVPPHRASGLLENVPDVLIFGDGLVTEDRVNTGYRHYRIRAENLPSGNYTINGTSKIRIGSSTSTMPIRLDVVEGSSVSIVSARRVSAQ